MPDLDLDKIRADIRLAKAEQSGRRLSFDEINATCDARDRIADVHADALLAIAEEHAVCEVVARGNRAYVADVIRTNQRLIAERDALRADAGPEAHPPVDGYWVEVYDPVDSDLPSEGWMAISSKKDTASEAADAMRRRRELRPTWGPMRVVRVRRSYAVVAVEESRTDAQALPPPADAPSCPPGPPHPASAPPAEGP